MLCPRCTFEGELVDGGCARCGYGRSRMSSGPLYAIDRRVAIYNSADLAVRVLAPGDLLREGRYRVVKQLLLPKNQQNQGTAWLASDTQALRGMVVIRSVIPPKESSSNAEQVVRAAALRLATLGQYPGFPNLLDVFAERGSYYVVFQHSEGKRLAELLRERGGTLPERIVAEYGRQLCEMLQVLSSQHPPLVHGSINPETVMVSPDGKSVSLMYMPLFAPMPLSSARVKTESGYFAPEQVYESTGQESDIYGLAATLHHALTGFDPNEHMAFFYPPVRSLSSAVSSRMEAILRKALRSSVAHRYLQVAVMQQDLESVLALQQDVKDSAAVVAIPLPQRDAVRDRRQRIDMINRGVYATISAGVCLLLIIGFLFVMPHNPPAYKGSIPNAAGTIVAMRNATATAVVRKQIAALNAELAPEAQIYTSKGIGVSDGHFVFDVYAPRSDVALKQQAAQAIQKSDISTAANLLQKAISADPIDGEARIYAEDLAILQHGLPFVTIVLGIGYANDADILSIERADIRAAFLAQYEINEFGLLPDNLYLRVLIANSGPDSTDVATIANTIVKEVTRDGNPDHIIAVAGWPTSAQTIQASGIIATAHLPLVSPTASSEKLSGINSYFFRVNPSDNAQADALATIAAQQLHATTVLVMSDPDDAESMSIADAFTARLGGYNVEAINRPRDDFTEMMTTVSGYRTAINDALANNVDVIFLAGSDVDAIRLAHAVGNASRANPTNRLLARLKILGSSSLALNTGLLLGQCSGGDSLEEGGDSCADAFLASNYPQDLQRLSFISLGDPQEWYALHLPAIRRPPFFTDWAGLFQNSVVSVQNALPPDQNVMLTYDALQIIVRAAQAIQGPLAGQPIHDSLTSLGAGITPIFQGVSGRILFDAQGNPIDKAIAVLYVESAGGVNVIKLGQITGTFQ